MTCLNLKRKERKPEVEREEGNYIDFPLSHSLYLSIFPIPLLSERVGGDFKDWGWIMVW